MKVVRYFGKLVLFCLLVCVVGFGLLMLIYYFSKSTELSILVPIAPVFLMFVYIMPWLFKNEINEYNKMVKKDVE